MSEWKEKRLPSIARVVLGLIFAVMGLNGFFQFIPTPSMPEDAGTFMGALAATGYMMPLIKSVEVVSGMLLLVGRFVPLALVLLAPNIVNILLFHVFLAPGGLLLALLLLALELYLAWTYRDVYRPLLGPNTTPTDQRSPSRRYAFHSQVIVLFGRRLARAGGVLGLVAARLRLRDHQSRHSIAPANSMRGFTSTEQPSSRR